MNQKKTVAFLVMLALTMLSRAADASEAPLHFPDNVSDVESCYSGDYANAQAFVDSLRDRPGFAPPMAKGMQRAYARWRQTADCKMFTYKVDGIPVRGFVVFPPETTERRPVVIFNRGGNADTGEIPFRYIIGKLFPLVEKGFVVIGSQYRGASRNGVASEYRLTDEFGGRDVADVLGLLPIIRKLPFADSSRVGMWGVSRGGMMAYLAARAEPNAFSAMVAEAAPTDLRDDVKFQPGMEKVFSTWIPRFELDSEAALTARSAIAWSDELPVGLPILLLHGRLDTSVPPSDSLRMASALQDQGHPYGLIVYESGTHSLGRDASVGDDVIQWFSRHLGDPKREGEQ